jgi:hypothetical protein
MKEKIMMIIKVLVIYIVALAITLGIVFKIDGYFGNKNAYIKNINVANDCSIILKDTNYVILFKGSYNDLLDTKYKDSIVKTIAISDDTEDTLCIFIK